MNATLTDRYIDAATRTAPESQRPDIAAELRERIADQVDALVDAGEAPDAAERAVLNELGDPDELVAGYIDRPLQLIGPRYYLTWWRLLKLLWAIVPACVVFGVALGMAIDGESFGAIVGAVVPVVIQVIVNIGFWTTLVFVIIERSTHSADIGLVGEWTVDRLPEPRENGAKVSDLVASLIFLGLAAGAVLWDHFVGFVYFSDAGWLPFLSPQLWPWGIGVLLAAIAAEALLAIAVYAKGRYTWALAAANLVLNVVIAVPAVWLLSEGGLVNPEFWPRVIPADSSATVESILTIIFGFVIAGIAIWDSVDGFLKARRSTRP